MSVINPISVGNVVIGGGKLVLIAGPDVIEDLDTAVVVASKISELCKKYDIGYIFKSSYKKDNRTSGYSYSGPGITKGLEVLSQVKELVNVPVTSDVHGIQDVMPASEVLDLIQIPAFLCKQTSLLFETGKTNRPVNVKKGQFMDPLGMKYVAEKIASTGNNRVVFTERGTLFGYNNLINDFRSLPIMRSFGCPVIYDVGHSIRMIGVPSENKSGGQPIFIPTLMRAALAAGCDGIFIEVHPNPLQALCDSSSQYPLGKIEELLAQAKVIFDASQQFVKSEDLSAFSDFVHDVDKYGGQ